MAQQSPKTRDAAEAALSAVEAALSPGHEQKSKSGEASEHAESVERAVERVVEAAREKPDASGAESRQSSRETKSAHASPKQSEPPRPPEPEPANDSRQPANDDRPSLSHLVYSMHRRPSRAPYWIALVVSLVWLGIGGAFAWGMYGPAMLAVASPTVIQAQPGIIVAYLALVLPVFLFFATAAMAWRAQDLRMASRSLTEAAIRLAEPEGIAKESVVTVGQAVRRLRPGQIGERGDRRSVRGHAGGLTRPNANRSLAASRR